MTLRRWIIGLVFLGMVAGCGEYYSSGDRVLVSKLAYDTGVTAPSRFDVVVFKFPGNPHQADGPMEKHTPKNYIKRLLGLPGELIAIFFGRIYRRGPDEKDAPYYDDTGKEAATDLRKPRFMHVDDAKAKQWFDEGKFTIVRKAPATMLALRRLVYDNDYQAKDMVRDKIFRWNPAADSTWKMDGATGFATDGKAEQIDWLRYQHLEAALQKFREPMLILDTFDYNTFQLHNNMGNLSSAYASAHWVGDLMVECNLTVTQAKGEFWFELNKGPDKFRAGWDLATGVCTLFRETRGKEPEKLGTADTRVKGPGNYMLRFANIDARLTVWVDRDLPFGDGKDYDPPEVRKLGEKVTDEQLEARRGPTENDLKPASLGTKGSSVKIAHLRLWRDTYYRTSVDGKDYDNPLRMEQWADAKSWSELKRLNVTTMYVQPGHFLCLGDNSQSSSDSRYWGLVPERLMLGRALAVYYPLERIGPIR